MTGQGISGRVFRCFWALVPVLLMLSTLPSTHVGAAEPSVSEHWPNFRGPYFNGSARAENLPDRWSRSEGVLWSTGLPGVGSATPAIWGDRIFLIAADAETGDLFAMALDADDGKILWKHAHGSNRRHGRNDMTSP